MSRESWAAGLIGAGVAWVICVLRDTHATGVRENSAMLAIGALLFIAGVIVLVTGQ